MEQVHPLLASAGGGLDQSTASGQEPISGYIGNGCLTGSRGVIFPGSHRGATNSPDRKLLIRRSAAALAALFGLGLLALMCAPQTKNLDCTYSDAGGNRPQGESSLDVEPSGAPSSARRERFSINLKTKQIVFPGGGEIKKMAVPYTQKGNTVTFPDRLGGRLELNLQTGMLRNFAEADGWGRDRLSGTATCTGL